MHGGENGVADDQVTSISPMGNPLMDMNGVTAIGMILIICYFKNQSHNGNFMAKLLLNYF